MEELAHMGSAAGMKDESGPTTSGIPHGTQSKNYFCSSSLDLHTAKKNMNRDLISYISSH
jgi:hypothetical protein